MENEQKDLKPDLEVIDIPSTNDPVDKNEEEQSEETTQEETTQEEVQEETTEEETQEETQEEESEEESLQERLKKAEEERDNLSKAVTRLNKERKLPSDDEKEEDTEEDDEDWDESSKKFQKKTITKAEKVAHEQATKVLEKSNEKTAIEKFISDNPDADWDEVISNYNPKNGKDTVNGIVKDLNRALVLTRYDKGELTKKETTDKVDKEVADMSSVAKTTSKTTKGSNNVSPGSLELAGKMKVDPKKLAEEDDSLSAEINY